MPEVPFFGLDKERAEDVRATGPFVGLWFAVFALPLFFLVHETPQPFRPRRAVRDGLATLWQTLKRLPGHGQVGRFLLARMLYTDGLNTLFAFGGIYAAGSFGMSFQEILIFGILLNVTAGLGAFAFAWVDDLVGAKFTIMASVAALVVLGAAILLVESQTWFYVLGCGIGAFIGPAQTASRSFLARIVPPELSTEFFGLYALSGKVTAFLGPALVGWVTLWADSQRVGMATILLFFLAGLVLMAPLKDPQRRGSAAQQQGCRRLTVPGVRRSPRRQPPARKAPASRLKARWKPARRAWPCRPRPRATACSISARLTGPWRRGKGKCRTIPGLSLPLRLKPLMRLPSSGPYRGNEGPTVRPCREIDNPTIWHMICSELAKER